MGADFIATEAAMTREFRGIKKGEASPLTTFQTNIVSQGIAKPSFLKICAHSPVLLPPKPRVFPHLLCPIIQEPPNLLQDSVLCATGFHCSPILHTHFPFSSPGTCNVHSYLQVSSVLVFPCHSKDCWRWIKFEARFARMCFTLHLDSHCLLAAKWHGKET